MITLYGIPNCDTIKKARKWLDAEGVSYRFHDYRKEGLNADQLNAWCDELGWENLLNRRGTTWRQLPEAEREQINRERAVALMLAHPAMIKRPLLDLGSARKLGFKEADYQSYFV
ncbi:ArsC family reductase [Motiliproteus sediminis]|uniref:ArsC family reductase n=1 Tax=Motiliproteus sediminis TaxID=1468178 RepID=UPI001AF01F9B|nr:ArsC family reductase [Motiliproteus sediminis]